MSTVNRVPWARVLVEGLVIAGSILLALATDAWWDGVKERAEERALLSELRTTVSEDLAAVTLGRDTIAAASLNLALVAERFEGGNLEERGQQYQGEVRALGRFTQVVVRYGPFETLKDRGLTLISNPVLRVSLTSLYEDELPILQSNAEIDRALSRDRMLPFQLDHFVIDGTGAWRLNPRTDEAEVRLTGMTLARFRHGTLVQFYLPSYERAISLMTELIEQIDLELASD